MSDKCICKSKPISELEETVTIISNESGIVAYCDLCNEKISELTGLIYDPFLEIDE